MHQAPSISLKGPCWHQRLQRAEQHKRKRFSQIRGRNTKRAPRSWQEVCGLAWKAFSLSVFVGERSIVLFCVSAFCNFEMKRFFFFFFSSNNSVFKDKDFSALKYIYFKSIFLSSLSLRMRVKKLPMILALHLKRFKYMDQLHRYTKLSYRVVFPLELRLFNTSGDATNPDRLYDLVAVVVHCGR